MYVVQQVFRDAGISQAQLARAIRKSPAAVSQFFSNRLHGGGAGMRRLVERAAAQVATPEQRERLWDIVPDAPEPQFEITVQPKSQSEDTMQRGLSQEVLRWYGLFRDPFSHPESRDEVYRTHNLALAEGAIVDCAEKHQFCAVIGDTGSGKTTARDSALDRLAKSGRVRVIYPEPLICDRLTAPMICTVLLTELDQRVPQDLSQRTVAVRKMLQRASANSERCLLVIEEAHLLHPSTLRSLKHLYEIQSGFQKLLGILLIGQGSLEQRLGQSHLEEVSSRCRRVRLMEMSLEEVGGYLDFRIKAVRQDTPAEAIFAPEAVRWIAARAKFPQAVNNAARDLMERAYQMRHVTGARTIGRDVLAG